MAARRADKPLRVARNRLIQAGLLLPLIALAASCGGDGGGRHLFDANATYQCLTHRPDYHSGDWFAHQHDEKALGPTFYIIESPRKQLAYDPDYLFKVGPVRKIELSFYANDIQAANLLFFDDATRPALLKRWLLKRFPPGTGSPGPGFPSVDPEFTVERNVFIDTTPTPFAKTGPTRSIVLGCLRTS